MKLCKLVEIEGRPGFQWCPECKRERGWPQGQRQPRPMPTKYLRDCVPPKPAAVAAAGEPEPSILQRVKRYKSARDRWVEAGKPIRSDEDKAALFAICEACPSEKYEARPIAPGLSGGRCKACSCGLARERNTLNKIAWSTEDCPLGHWPRIPIADPPASE
jgi:hypothetical protein